MAPRAAVLVSHHQQEQERQPRKREQGQIEYWPLHPGTLRLNLKLCFRPYDDERLGHRTLFPCD